MARTATRLQATSHRTLRTLRRNCPCCGRRMWNRYDSRRSIATMRGVVGLLLKVRRCQNSDCTLYRHPYRPETEGHWSLPQQEFGLDVIAAVGRWRYREHRSVPEMACLLQDRGVSICERSVTNLLDRYDELLSLSLTDQRRLRAKLSSQGQVILALDGLQPDVGHEVLWVLRDCISGQVLLARSLLSATTEDLSELIRQVKQALGESIPIGGVISDGQRSIRRAVARALPGVDHQLCQFHYLREAARPIYEADRHAKVQLKKKVRGVRPIEREVEGRDDPEAQAVRGYCAAVRSAITDDGRPPLEASGLKLRRRLSAVADSLDRVRHARHDDRTGEKGDTDC